MMSAAERISTESRRQLISTTSAFGYVDVTAIDMIVNLSIRNTLCEDSVSKTV